MVTGDEEPHWKCARTIFLVFGKVVWRRYQPVDERPAVQAAFRINKMQTGGWGKGMCPVLFSRVVRGKKPGAEYRTI